MKWKFCLITLVLLAAGVVEVFAANPVELERTLEVDGSVTDLVAAYEELALEDGRGERQKDGSWVGPKSVEIETEGLGTVQLDGQFTIRLSENKYRYSSYLTGAGDTTIEYEVVITPGKVHYRCAVDTVHISRLKQVIMLRTELRSRAKALERRMKGK